MYVDVGSGCACACVRVGVYSRPARRKTCWVFVVNRTSDGAKERERMLRKDKLRKENEVCEIFLSRPWWLRWQVSIWVGGMVEVGEKGWLLGHSLRKLGWPHTANKPFGWLPSPFGWLPSPHREVRIDSRRVDLRRVPGGWILGLQRTRKESSRFLGQVARDMPAVDWRQRGPTLNRLARFDDYMNLDLNSVLSDIISKDLHLINC